MDYKKERKQLRALINSVESLSEDADISNKTMRKFMDNGNIRVDKVNKIRGVINNMATELCDYDPDYRLKTVYDWLTEEYREPAETAFTAGWMRNLAREIEFRMSVKGK